MRVFMATIMGLKKDEVRGVFIELRSVFIFHWQILFSHFCIGFWSGKHSKLCCTLLWKFLPHWLVEFFTVFFLSFVLCSKLLWHGSRLTNWVGILSQGLRIAPPEAPVTGYMVSMVINELFLWWLSSLNYAVVCWISAFKVNPKRQPFTVILPRCRNDRGKGKKQNHCCYFHGNKWSLMVRDGGAAWLEAVRLVIFHHLFLESSSREQEHVVIHDHFVHGEARGGGGGVREDCLLFLSFLFFFLTFLVVCSLEKACILLTCAQKVHTIATDKTESAWDFWLCARWEDDGLGNMYERELTHV